MEDTKQTLSTPINAEGQIKNKPKGSCIPAPWNARCLGLTLVCMVVVMTDTAYVLAMASTFNCTMYGLPIFPNLNKEASNQFSMEDLTFGGIIEGEDPANIGDLLFIRVIFNAVFLMSMVVIVVLWDKKILILVNINIVLSILHVILTLTMIMCEHSIIKGEDIHTLYGLLELILCLQFTLKYLVISGQLSTEKWIMEKLKLSAVVVVPKNHETKIIPY